MTIDFALLSTNRGNKRLENSSDFGRKNNKGKTNSATRLASGKGTRNYSKVLGSATTGNSGATNENIVQNHLNIELLDVS